MLNHGGLYLTASLRIRQTTPTFVSHIARVLYLEVKLERSKKILIYKTLLACLINLLAIRFWCTVSQGKPRPEQTILKPIHALMQ